MLIQLAAEMEAALQAEATARGVSLEAILSDALKLYQTERINAEAETGQTPFNHRRLEIAWTDLGYRGEWVALEGSKVIAHGRDGSAVSAWVRSKNIPSPFLFFVPDPDPIPFVGGWLESTSE